MNCATPVFEAKSASEVLKKRASRPEEVPLEERRSLRLALVARVVSTASARRKFSRRCAALARVAQMNLSQLGRRTPNQSPEATPGNCPFCCSISLAGAPQL